MAGQVGVIAALHNALEFVGETSQLLGQSLARMLVPPYEVRETVNQASFIGAESVPIVALTTFSSGAVLSLYFADVMMDFGASSLIGASVGLSVAREIGPLLAGIMVAARAGSAMAAQIGTMAVTEQIDALRALNVKPIDYLVVPRMIAAIIMMPILAMVGIFAGVFGGGVVALYQAGVPSGTFFSSLRTFVTPWDIQAALIKSVIFGIIVVIVACQQGMRTKGGAVGVGQATTRSVVISMVLIYVANFGLAWLLFK